jgi:outer membrane receptor protein involved in Fe transport
MTMILRPQLAAIAAGLLAVSTPGFSEEVIEEVIVTAELREVTLLQQAASTSVVDQEQIRLRAAEHLENILGLMPNVNFAGGSSRARYYQVRGIGERSQFVEPLNPSVGLVVDDIDLSGLGTAGSLFDVEQVEVLRGPQGTLHGANALAGLINIRSGAPEDRFRGYLDASVADYDTHSLGAMLTGPLSDDLAFRLAVNQLRSDGFMKNAFLNSDRTNDRDERMARGRLRWMRGENQIDLTLLLAEVDNGYDAFSLDNTRTTLSDEPGRDTIDLTAVAFKWQRSLEHVDFEWLLTAADSDTGYSYDEDWSYVGIAPGWEYSSFDLYARQRDSYSAQWRLLSRQPVMIGNAPADWVVGLYWLDDDESLRRSYTYLAEDFTSRYQASTLALFGQLDLQLNRSIVLSGGLRIARRSTDYRDANGVDSDPSATLWGGKLALEHTTEQDQLLYASISRGYRANGVNAGIISSPDAGGMPGSDSDLAFYEEELLLNYEIGHKASAFDGALSSRFALFFMDRQDQQVKGSLVVPREDGSTAFIDYTDNAASGSHYGLEWEIDWQASDALRLHASLGLLRADFDQYVNADGVDLSGRDQAHAPRYQFAAGALVNLSSHWYLAAEIEGKDSFYFSDRHTVKSGSYRLGHLRLGYATDRWNAALWVRNLSDQDYFIRGFGSFGNDPRKEYALEPYYQYGDPQRVGASLQVFFR